MAHPTTKNPKIFGTLVIAEFDRYVNKVTRETRAAIKWAGETILEHTLPITPLDTGALRESGRVDTESEKVSLKHKIAAYVKFGGRKQVTPTKNAPAGIVNYATIVHETNQAYRVGQWKYLQEGLNRALPQIRRGVAERLKDIRIR